MKPTSKQPEQLSGILEQLEDKLKKIEGHNPAKSGTVKNQETNQQAMSGSSGSVSPPTTPRLTSGIKSTEKGALTFDGSKVNGDPHTPPTRKRELKRQTQIKEEVMHRPKKSSDEEKSTPSSTPRSVRFATSDATSPVSNRSAASTPTSTPMTTPMPTPRKAGAKDDSSSDSSGSTKPRSPRTKELRKRISKGFSKAALNIGKLGENYRAKLRL